jgi:2-phosphosulfolactate phosphatase
MQINILHLVEGAQQAKGLTVIIDVFRAFTTACYIMEKQPQKLILVEHLEQAFLLKEKYSDCLLIGERHEQKPEGFDFGNSPTHILNANIANKVVIQSTSAGTKGVLNAIHAEEIISGSFVNIQSIVNYILFKKPKHLSLVCMGYAAEKPSDEDTFCAESIIKLIHNETIQMPSIIEKLKTGAGARFFLAEKQHYAPANDFYLCTHMNTFNFVLKGVQIDEGIELKKITI